MAPLRGLLLSLPAAAGEPEHVCGEGPREVTFETYGDDCNTTTCTVVKGWATDSYARHCTRTLMGCIQYHTEIWTDWPECEGAERVGEDG